MSNLEGASTKSMRRRCGQPHNTSISSTSNKIQEKKKLVLDLDETLVHSFGSINDITTGGSTDVKCDFSYTEGESTSYTYLRPHVHKFLERVSELFDVYIFTAGYKEHADRVLDFLDPQGKLIVGRYYNDSLSYPDADGGSYAGSCIKDLSIFGDPAKVILVDNDPNNFRKQKDNGIAIQSWYSDPQDEELISTVLPLLERLAAANDVRPIISERYNRSKNDKRGGGKQVPKQKQQR